jgi:hypothetical protein
MFRIMTAPFVVAALMSGCNADDDTQRAEAL